MKPDKEKSQRSTKIHGSRSCGLHNYWLVVSTSLKNDWDDYSQCMENKKCSKPPNLLVMISFISTVVSFVTMEERSSCCWHVQSIDPCIFLLDLQNQRPLYLVVHPSSHHRFLCGTNPLASRAILVATLLLARMSHQALPW